VIELEIINSPHAPLTTKDSRASYKYKGKLGGIVIMVIKRATMLALGMMIHMRVDVIDSM
jgi:hypothetical protein